MLLVPIEILFIAGIVFLGFKIPSWRARIAELEKDNVRLKAEAADLADVILDLRRPRSSGAGPAGPSPYDAGARRTAPKK